MDRFYNSKRHNMTNYLDIFKACRLCGSGGGYKMPIIQKLHNDDVIDVEAELKQKIRECVSIDVHPDDRMPPLICELCVDKVNDFYEFREMCRATNARVRASLGLPPQNLSQDVNEDCILGVSGPLFHSSIENDGSAKKEKNKSNKKSIGIEKKSLRSGEPSPPVVLDRSSRRRHTDSPLLGGSSKRPKYSTPSPSSSPILEKRKPSKGTESLAVEAKRLRDTRDNKAADVKKGNLLQKQKELLAQKAKDLRAKELAAKNKSAQKVKEAAQKAKELKEAQKAKEQKELQKAKEAREAQKAKLAEQRAKEAALKKKQVAAAMAVTTYKCDHCAETFTKQIEQRQHINFMHTPLYIEEKMSCTPCKEWFATVKEADAHHKWHKTSNTYYNCQRCSTDFKVLLGFTKHFQRKQCIPYETVPDVKCNVCMGMFATENWKEQHKCPGPPKDMCKKCMSVFQGRVALKRHERRCKGIIVPVNPNNPHLKELRPLSISVGRCDNMVRRIKTEPGVLDNIKQEPIDFEESHINIKQEIKQEMEDYNSDYEGYGGIDDGGYSSDDSVSETDTPQAPHMVRNPFARKNTTQVDSLSIISLRTIFGGKLLGKRTRRKKKKNPKIEAMTAGATASTSAEQTAFDSLFDSNQISANDSTEADHMENNETTDQSGDKDTTENSTNNATTENIETDDLFNSLQSSAENNQEIDAVLNSVVSLKDSEGNETLAENILNEIMDKTEAAQVDGLIEEPMETSSAEIVNSEARDVTVPDVVVDSTLPSQIEHSACEEQVSESGDVGKQNVLSQEPCVASVGNVSCSVDVTPSVNSTKTFVEGFALDPEVEALLMEDDDITTNELSLKDKEALDSDINDIFKESLITKSTVSIINAMENSEDGAQSKGDKIPSHINEILNETPNEVSETSNEVCRTPNEVSETSNEVCRTPNEVSETSNEVCRTPNEVSEAPNINETSSYVTEPISDIEKSISLPNQLQNENIEELSNTVLNEGGSENVYVVQPNMNEEENMPNNGMETQQEHCALISENTVETHKEVISGEQTNEEVNPVQGEVDNIVSNNKCVTEDARSTDAETKRSDDVMDLISDSGDDCNIVDSPEKARLNEEQLLEDEKQPTEPSATVLSEEQLLNDDDKQIDEESLLTTKDDGNCADIEMTQQDEDMLLGKDDQDDTLPQEPAPAPVISSLSMGHHDLEKISDDEFDMD